jgi:CubicO group peptidase (beta-lactamase class C family)
MQFIALALSASIALTAPALGGYEEAASYNARTGGVTLLILEDGDTAFERYAKGGAPEAAHELASGTKSFSGVIAAVAVKDGLLALLD